MPRERIHIVKHPDGWAIKKEGRSRAMKVFETQSEAISEAKDMDADILIHNKHGEFRRYDRGYKGSNDEGCFITTACVEYYKLTDNCYQLETLRKFRDSFMAKTSKNKKLVDQYYKVAPKIVAELNRHEDKTILYKIIFRNINTACKHIELSQFSKAKEIYIGIILRLIKELDIK